MQFRDYQLDAIAQLFREFGVEPAGPETDQIVARCRGNWPGEDGNYGRASEELANGSSDDDKPPIRVEPTSNEPTQLNLW